MGQIYNIEDLRNRLQTGEAEACYCRAVLGSRGFFDQELIAIQEAFPHSRILCLDSLVFPEKHGLLQVSYAPSARNWDFIYSSDLLGRLPDPAAKQAVKAAWSGLRPGGRLLLANTCLADHISACPKCASPGRAYRTELELAEIVKDFPDTMLAGKAVFRDDTGLNVYLELSKAPDRPETVRLVS